MEVVVSSLCHRVLQKPQMAGEMDVAALGKLLPEELLKPLEDQYLNRRQVTGPPAAAPRPHRAAFISPTRRLQGKPLTLLIHYLHGLSLVVRSGGADHVRRPHPRGCEGQVE